MADRPFLVYWDSVWQFLDDLVGAVSLFALLWVGLWASHIFG